MAKNLTRSQADAPSNFPEPEMQPAEAVHERVKGVAQTPPPKLGKAGRTVKTDHGAVRTDYI